MRYIGTMANYPHARVTPVSQRIGAPLPQGAANASSVGLPAGTPRPAKGNQPKTLASMASPLKRAQAHIDQLLINVLLDEACTTSVAQAHLHIDYLLHHRAALMGSLHPNEQAAQEVIDPVVLEGLLEFVEVTHASLVDFEANSQRRSPRLLAHCRERLAEVSALSLGVHHIKARCDAIKAALQALSGEQSTDEEQLSTLFLQVSALLQEVQPRRQPLILQALLQGYKSA